MSSTVNKDEMSEIGSIIKSLIKMKNEKSNQRNNSLNNVAKKEIEQNNRARDDVATAEDILIEP